MIIDLVLADALEGLAGSRLRREDAAKSAPRRAGLYAIYGDEQAWVELRLKTAFKDQPLYVGKAERSLNGRDVGTHFALGKTGSSTVRRSLAALLADELDLDPVPRNLGSPNGSANFALDPESDGRLSHWMEDRLTVATWVNSNGVDLGELETAVLLKSRPPLNLEKVGEPRERLRKARRHMANISRAWKPRPTQTSELLRMPVAALA